MPSSSMLKSIFALALVYLSIATTSNVYGQTEEDSTAMVISEVAPQYPGGLEQLYRDIGANFKYPDEELVKGIEGRILLKFIVEKDGSLSNITIHQGIPGGKGLEQEAIRVVGLLKPFEPGLQNGKPVRTEMVLPIKCQVTDRKKRKK